MQFNLDGKPCHVIRRHGINIFIKVALRLFLPLLYKRIPTAELFTRVILVDLPVIFPPVRSQTCSMRLMSGKYADLSVLKLPISKKCS